MNEESRKKQKTRRQRGNCSRGRHMTIKYYVQSKREREREKPPQSKRKNEREKKRALGKGVERQKVIKRRVDETRSKGFGKLAELCRVDYL